MSQKIVIVSEWYSPGMGYSENHFPRALAKLGYEVFLLTSNLQVYATSSKYNDIYQSTLGDKYVSTGISFSEGVYLIRLDSRITDLGIELKGLSHILHLIQPSIIHAFEIDTYSTYQLVKELPNLDASLICESRLHSSISQTKSNSIHKKIKYDISRKYKRIKTIGKINASIIIEKSKKILPIAPDVEKNIKDTYGVSSEKCVPWSLGYNSELFDPKFTDTEIQSCRQEHGFEPNDIVCIYTGRLTREKGPQILAKALLDLWHRGYKEYKGLFVGQGEKDIEELIQKLPNCKRINFVSQKNLPILYQSSDIGVWPLQESTSQIDAAASGIPIVVSNMVEDKFRYENNGKTYLQDCHLSLAETLLQLRDKKIRNYLGDFGATKMHSNYSWDALASRYSKLLCQINS